MEVAGRRCTDCRYSGSSNPLDAAIWCRWLPMVLPTKLPYGMAVPDPARISPSAAERCKAFEQRMAFMRKDRTYA